MSTPEMLDPENKRRGHPQCHSVKHFLSQFTQFYLSGLAFLFLK